MPDEPTAQQAAAVRRVLELATVMRTATEEVTVLDDELTENELAQMLVIAMTLLVASVRVICLFNEEAEDEMWQQIALDFALELGDA